MAYGYGYGFQWRPYVSVGDRLARARREARRRAGKGRSPEPVTIEGRTIAHTFWGRKWCDHMEGFGDFANRLPRGRTYVRNGSVVDLRIEQGRVLALVAGSEPYAVEVTIKTLPRPRWQTIVRGCAGRIGSLVSLLRGKLSDAVIDVLARPEGGLLPTPGEMGFSCSCPDWAKMCKHVAAVLYGVGARLDHAPDLLFVLRKVDQTELVRAAPARALAGAPAAGRAALAGEDLAGIFGIELDDAPGTPPGDGASTAEVAAPPPARRARPAQGATAGRARAGGADRARARREAERERRIAEFERELDRLRPRPAAAPKLVRRRAAKVTPRMAEARRVQGRYLGALKRLSGAERAHVKDIARTRGVAPAVDEARRLLAARGTRASGRAR